MDIFDKKDILTWTLYLNTLVITIYQSACPRQNKNEIKMEIWENVYQWTTILLLLVWPRFTESTLFKEWRHIEICIFGISQLCLLQQGNCYQCLFKLFSYNADNWARIYSLYNIMWYCAHKKVLVAVCLGLR